MGFGEAISTVFKKYAVIDGRASRSEYWWWTLFIIIMSVVLTFVDAALFGTMEYGILGTVFSLATLLPSITVNVRRLHDIDKSGWWYLLWILPIIGWIVLIWWAATKGTEGDNRYGADPLGADVGEVFS